MDVPNVTLSDSWAEDEFGAVNLGDRRLNRRLVDLAHVLGQRPAHALPHAAQDPARLKAAYRFFDHDDDDFTTADMLQAHVQATYDRCAAVPLVLAVADTTVLDWSAHPATTGLGPVTHAAQRGLLLHTTMIFTPERVALGLLALQMWARDADTFGTTPPPKAQPITEKESHKWLDSLHAVNLAATNVPSTTFVLVADAEADVYDLLRAERAPNVQVLIRAGQDRCVDHPAGHLWAAMQQAPVGGTLQVQIGPRAAVAGAYGKPGQAAQATRTATVQVRFATHTIQVPKNRPKAERLRPVTLGVVWAVEPDPPAGVEPLTWMLLTSVIPRDGATALELVAWYCCRWGIEVWHKVLKSGCVIETRQLQTAARLERCLALFGVIAWRIVFATMLGRALPEVPCTAVLSDDEWEALYMVTHRTTELPQAVPTLHTAIRWIARLGGFVGRASDGHPGITVLWRGFHELAALTTMHQVYKRDHAANRPRSRINQHVGND